MDPTATWERFLEHLEANEQEDAKDAINDLAEWLFHGGLPPEGFTLVQARMLVAIIRRNMF